MLAFALLWSGSALPDPQFGEVVRLDHGSLVSRWGGIFRETGEAGAELKSGRAMMAEGAALIALSAGGTLRARPGARWQAQAVDRIALERGCVYFDFSQGPHGRPFSIETVAGTIEHTGTQFEVAVADATIRIRVREGTVRLRRPAGSEIARAGVELVASKRGAVVRRPILTYGDDWAWVEALAPDLDIEDRSLLEALRWFARETGRDLHFMNPSIQEIATRTRLHGTIEGLAPVEAMNAVLSTTSMRGELRSGEIQISSEAWAAGFAHRP